MCTNFWINPHNGKLPSRLAPAQCQNSLAPQLLSNIYWSKTKTSISLNRVYWYDTMCHIFSCYKCWIETDCSSPTNCDWHVVIYKYDVQCFDCHPEGDLMCMHAFRIILYWTLNYYPFASFDHALENHGHFLNLVRITIFCTNNTVSFVCSFTMATSEDLNDVSRNSGTEMREDTMSLVKSIITEFRELKRDLNINTVNSKSTSLKRSTLMTLVRLNIQGIKTIRFQCFNIRKDSSG